MYDFYPEWGPARNRDEDEAERPRRNARYWSHERREQRPAMAGAGRAETRDADFQRPDDN